MTRVSLSANVVAFGMPLIKKKKRRKKERKKRLLSAGRNVNGGNARVSSANRAKHIITEFPGLNVKNRKLRLIHQVTLSL